MAYDIFGGEYLRPGHCEVHPNIHEEYPCSRCYSDRKRADRERAEEDAYYAALAEEEWRAIYADMADDGGLEGLS